MTAGEISAMREISIEDPMTHLARVGEWLPAGRDIALGPQMSALVAWIDAKVVEFAVQTGAHELPVPALIERSILECAGYFESFPARMVEELQGGCMPPATCYHCYAKIAGTSLPEPGVWTCITRCRRNEDKEEAGRLQTFTMREIVFIGSAAWVRERRQEWMDRILAFAQSLHLIAQLDAATDSFFASEVARGRKLLQQIKELKFELRAQIDAKATPLAIASFNLHEAFFSRRFRFRLADDTDAYSGCVAFGLERWAFALALTLGPDRAFSLVEQGQR
jgi:seryl-tRNA synthetase